MQKVRPIKGMLRELWEDGENRTQSSPHISWGHSCRIRWTTNRANGNEPNEGRQDGLHQVESTVYRESFVQREQENGVGWSKGCREENGWKWRQRQSQPWFMLYEGFGTLILKAMLDTHGICIQENYRIIFEFYNVTLPISEGWIRRGIIDGRKMCYRSTKIMWRIYTEVLRVSLDEDCGFNFPFYLFWIFLQWKNIAFVTSNMFS